MKAIKTTLKFIILGFVLLFASCKSTFYLEKAKDTDSDALVYALPKSKVVAEIEITKDIRQKGIFSDYINLYFNTKNAVLKNSTKYFITDISLKTIPVKDTSLIYRIVSSKNTNPLLLNLSKESFITGINLNDNQAETVNTEQNKFKDRELKTASSEYADISLHSVREVQYDTIYKEVKRDSVITKIPVITKKEVYKTKAKQAKETAEIIFNLRDDRYALLTGENDGNNFPDGVALKQMLVQLSELEKNYMSLFTGREMKIKKYYRFEFIPSDNMEENIEALFYFSNNKGITNDTTDTPVFLKFAPKKCMVKTMEKTNEKKNGILYRIPGKADVTVSLKDTELYKTELDIPQIGILNLIPGKLFKSKITVEFYPELGSLKRISE